MDFRPVRIRTYHAAPRRRRKALRAMAVGFGVIGLAIGLYALAGFYGVPWLVDHRLAQWRTADGGPMASRQTVRFNPFTLVAEIAEIAVNDRETQFLFSAERVILKFAPRSLIEFRPVISTALLDRPVVSTISVDALQDFGRRAQRGALGQARVDRFNIVDGALSAGGAASEPTLMTAVDLVLTGFDGRTGNAAEIELNAIPGGDTALTATGSLRADFAQAEGQFRIDRFALDRVSQRFGSRAMPTGLAGSADFAGEFSVTSMLESPALALTATTLEISDISLSPIEGVMLTTGHAAGTARLNVASSDDGFDVTGQLAIDDVALRVRDSRVQPTQDYALNDAALLATLDDAGNTFMLSLEGRFPGDGAARFDLRDVASANGAGGGLLQAQRLPATLLSAYAAEAFDRRFVDGDADLMLQYARNDDGVDGSLRVVLHQPELTGPLAESVPGETDPPLDLAIALLEDSARVVDIEVPFSNATGRVRDAVIAALGERIERMAAAPFDTLESLTDNFPYRIDSVTFQPGDTALDDSAVASIMQLANALKARPRLGVSIAGGYRLPTDRNALAKQQIELHVQLATAGADLRGRPVAVDLNSARVRDVLDEFAGERLSPDRIAAIAARDDCRNDPECTDRYYQRIFDALVGNEAITTAALGRLGRFRAQSIVGALAAAGIADDRMETTTAGVVGGVSSGIVLPIELTVADPSG